MIMTRGAARKPGEEILEAVIVEEAVQIEACHYWTSCSGLTDYKHDHRVLGILVMRAGKT